MSTENQAITADAAANKIAADKLCVVKDCKGGQPSNDNSGSVMLRHPRFYRQAAKPGEEETAPRKYVCRFCRAEYVFSGAKPTTSEENPDS